MSELSLLYGNAIHLIEYDAMHYHSYEQIHQVVWAL